MSKTKELWHYQEEEKVWVGKYLNSQNISHWHTDNEIVHVDQGELDVMVDGFNYSLKKGDIIFIDSKKIHNMHAAMDNTIVSIIIFDNSLIKKYLSQFSLESPVLKAKYNFPIIYSSLYKELTSKPKFYQDNTKLIVQSLILDIYRNEKLIEIKNNKKFNEKLLELLDQINNNYRYFTFEDASKLMNMNPSYFSRFFHNMVGIPFAKYLNCVKVEKAVELMSENPNIKMTEIADICGFQTIRNFNRIFKTYTHYSPKNIPEGYVFNGLSVFDDGNVQNPTLNSCKLIEFSSPHN